MGEPEINPLITGGSVQGVVGAKYVYIDNFNVVSELRPRETRLPQEKGVVGSCPYPGLTSFLPQDSELFFGRDQAVGRLETAVTQRSLTALVGASGSGKSSVVLAGLAPRLAGCGEWRFTHFRIGTEVRKDPFLALARALVPLLDSKGGIDSLESIQSLATKLEEGTVTFANALGGCRAQNPQKRILIIADQFEEVFTLIGEESRRRRFIEVLLSGFRDDYPGDRPQISLILTLRGDFYGAAILHRPLADALQGRVENLGPMTRSELEEAVLRPAGKVTFDEGLIHSLLDEVEKSPGNLPLLQFALREMWRRQQAGRITWRSYNELGGVSGALARRAQAIFDALTKQGTDEGQVRSFRRLFTRLITFGEGSLDVRRVVDRSELDAEDWGLAQRLANEDNRLVVTSAPEPEHETAEIVHEALISNWPTLSGWISSDRHFQSWLRQLRPSLAAWRSAPEDKSRLLSGYPLATAEQWFGQRQADLSAEERKYVNTAIQWRDSEARKARRIKRAVFAGTLAAVIAVTWAWWNTRKAFKQADKNYRLAAEVANDTSQIVQDQILTEGIAQPSVLAKSLLETPLRAFDQISEEGETREEALDRLKLFETLFHNYANLNEQTEAIKAANDEFEVAKRWAAKDPSRPEWLSYMARSRQNQADFIRVASDPRASEKDFEESVQFATQLAAAHPEVRWQQELAHAYERLGDSFRDQRRFAEALAQFRNIEMLNERMHGGDNSIAWRRNMAIVHGKIGDMFMELNQLENADRECRLNIQISETLVREVPQKYDLSRGVAIAYERRAALRRKQQRLDEAVSDYEHELVVLSWLLQVDKFNASWARDAAIANEGLGDVALQKRNFAMALEFYRKYFETMISQFQQSPKNSWMRREVAVGYDHTALAEADLHRNREAKGDFERCLEYAKGATTAYSPRNPEPGDVGGDCKVRLSGLTASTTLSQTKALEE